MSREIQAACIATAAGVALILAVFGVSAAVRNVLANQPVSSSSPAPAAAHAPTLDPTVVTAGKSVFADNCSSCHGDAGQGAFGPNLRKRQLSVTRIAQVVAQGIKPNMPSFAKSVSPRNIQAVAAYTASLHASP